MQEKISFFASNFEYESCKAKLRSMFICFFFFFSFDFFLLKATCFKILDWEANMFVFLDFFVLESDLLSILDYLFLLLLTYCLFRLKGKRNLLNKKMATFDFFYDKRNILIQIT